MPVAHAKVAEEWELSLQGADVKACLVSLPSILISAFGGSGK